MLVYKNFIDHSSSDKIEKTLLSNNFPWFYFSTIIEDQPKECDPYIKQNFCTTASIFRHSFIHKQDISGDGIDLVTPLLNKIESLFNREVVFYNCNCNLIYTDNSLLGKHSYPHIDMSYHDDVYKEADCYTGLYYVNDCDGETLIWSDNDIKNPPSYKVMPEKNKFVYWDSKLLHSAPAAASKIRVGVNFNFCVKK
jgi:hypothetical protein